MYLWTVLNWVLSFVGALFSAGAFCNIVNPGKAAYWAAAAMWFSFIAFAAYLAFGSASFIVGGGEDIDAVCIAITICFGIGGIVLSAISAAYEPSGGVAIIALIVNILALVLGLRQWVVAKEIYGEDIL